MKKILSLMLSFTILTTFCVNTGFACDKENICHNEYVTDENVEGFTDNLLGNTSGAQYTEDLLKRHQFIVKDEMDSNLKNANANKVVKYGFLPLTWNLLKLILTTSLKAVSVVTIGAVALVAGVVVISAKVIYKTTSAVGKVVIRVPASLINVFTGYKDKKINDLKKELERLKEQECYCS